MRHPRQWILGLGILLGITAWTPVVQADNPAYQIKAAYIYNILKFVHFPPETGKDLTICILGENRFGDALNALDSASVPDSILHIAQLGRYTRGKHMAQCHVLYLVNSEKEYATTILANIDPTRTLTIGEHSQFLHEGGLIELYEKDDTIQFRINPEMVNRTAFKIDAQLVQLGIE